MLLDEKLIGLFQNDCVSCDLELKTILEYVHCVKVFFEHSQLTTTEDLDREDFLAYHGDLDSFNRYLVYEKNLHPHTINVYFCALERFFDFLVYFRYILINPIPLFRKRCRRIYKPVEPVQSYVPPLKEMAEFVKSIDDPTIKASIIMSSKCMFRLNEMLKQDKRAVNLQRRSTIAYKHKKRSNTLVFFDDEVEAALTDMINSRPNATPCLFIQKNGRPYTRETYRQHLINYAEKFGIYDADGPREMNFTFNSCRRFGVTQLMKSAIPPIYISFLRGDNIKSSRDAKEIYFGIDKNKVQEQYEKYIFKFNL